MYTDQGFHSYRLRLDLAINSCWAFIAAGAGLRKHICEQYGLSRNVPASMSGNVLHADGFSFKGRRIDIWESLCVYISSSVR